MCRVASSISPNPCLPHSDTSVVINRALGIFRSTPREPRTENRLLSSPKDIPPRKLLCAFTFHSQGHPLVTLTADLLDLQTHAHSTSAFTSRIFARDLSLALSSDCDRTSVCGVTLSKTLHRARPSLNYFTWNLGFIYRQPPSHCCAVCAPQVPKPFLFSQSKLAFTLQYCLQNNHTSQHVNPTATKHAR